MILSSIPFGKPFGTNNIIIIIQWVIYSILHLLNFFQTSYVVKYVVVSTTLDYIDLSRSVSRFILLSGFIYSLGIIWRLHIHGQYNTPFIYHFKPHVSIIIHYEYSCVGLWSSIHIFVFMCYILVHFLWMYVSTHLYIYIVPFSSRHGINQFEISLSRTLITL